MDKFMETLGNIWDGFLDFLNLGLVKFIIYLAIAFAVAGIAQWLITKVLKLVKLDKVFDKWGINEGEVGTSMSFVGKLVYIIVFLMFLPAAFGALGIQSVSQPITGLVNTFISYLPNIIGAIIVVYVGLFVARIIGHIVAVLLRKTKIDNLVATKTEDNKRVLLSDLIAKVVMGVIILVAVVSALDFLGIEAISKPALGIVEAIFGAIPDIILAVVIIALGLLVTELACSLLRNLLLSLNFDSVVKKVLPAVKVSSTKVVVNTVKTVIIFFIAAQAIEVLELAILTSIVTALIGYIPLVVKALVVAAVAFVGAGLIEGVIIKSNPKAAGIAKITKVAIYTIAGFMILSQLGIATTIVNTAFVLTLAAIAVSFALAFGLGGRDFAKKTLDKVDEKINENKNDENK